MQDPLRDVVSLYGTADAGVIGCETALRLGGPAVARIGPLGMGLLGVGRWLPAQSWD